MFFSYSVQYYNVVKLVTFLFVAKVILWFLTRFKHPQILRKLFSNAFSFPVLLPVVRDITPMKKTWNKL